jgi:hypothetical protein
MEQERASSSLATWALAILALLGLLASGCSPGVGSGCTLSTDCGTTGNLVCDTSEFEGYCTVQDCVPNECPNNAACVMFNPTIPGCGYDDYLQGSPVDQQFCMATCGSNSDCRNGYICADPTKSPWNAMLLDSTSSNSQIVTVCIPLPLEGLDAGNRGFDPDAAVCQTLGPPFDAAALYASFASDVSTDSAAQESGADAADAGD